MSERVQRETDIPLGDDTLLNSRVYLTYTSRVRITYVRDIVYTRGLRFEIVSVFQEGAVRRSPDDFGADRRNVTGGVKLVANNK